MIDPWTTAWLRSLRGVLPRDRFHLIRSARLSARDDDEYAEILGVDWSGHNEALRHLVGIPATFLSGQGAVLPGVGETPEWVAAALLLQHGRSWSMLGITRVAGESSHWGNLRWRLP